MSRPIVHHIPVCPFSQRLEILLALKGLSDAVGFEVVDITKPRDPRLLELSGGTTALPVLETEHGHGLKESLVLLRYLEDRFPAKRIAADTPYRRAVESMMITLEGDFGAAGYRLVMNQAQEQRDAHIEALLKQYARLDAFLVRHAEGKDFLFADFGLAETVFTPFFQRFWFNAWYEGFDLPDQPEYARVRRWRERCLAHPAAQQVTEEQIVKLYYDYSRGVGNGALPEGRTVSSFTFVPAWQDRPMPPRSKYGKAASDAELGLLGAPTA